MRAVGGQTSGCFKQSTYKTGWPVLGHVSSVWNTPPFSLYMIQRTADSSFSQSTRLWYIFALCSRESSPLLVERNFAQMRNLSSTIILCYPASQASNLQSIHRRISQYLRTWFTMKFKNRLHRLEMVIIYVFWSFGYFEWLYFEWYIYIYIFNIYLKILTEKYNFLMTVLALRTCTEPLWICVIGEGILNVLWSFYLPHKWC